MINFNLIKNRYILTAFFIIFTGFFIFANHSFSQVEISVPTIVVNPDTYYPMEEFLYLEGNAVPNFSIQIRFQKQGAKPVTFTAKSDPRGEWVFAEKVPLEAGDWEVRARTIDAEDQDKVSEWSNPRVFKVIISGITIGGINIKFAALSLVIIILLICGVVLIVYFNWRVRRLKTTLIGKEIREAQESVREGFVELRQNLLDELNILESRKKLSREELIRKEDLLRNLENLERGMQSEIRDIEEEVK
ncbi:MAG: hypothetical protein NTW46_03340 [Candidatus Nealsonbacteria bacterium]|nr:hypothetical protein [Candidatus Nealsonbacteria bacterium]